MRAFFIAAKPGFVAQAQRLTIAAVSKTPEKSRFSSFLNGY
jgi:hypothetical protein